MENDNKPATKRLQSIDALRGFDMFWIMGGRHIFLGLATLTGWPVFQWWAAQVKHTEWHGFTFYDMIFPLFLFIAGMSFPFSLAKRTTMNENRKSLYLHVIRRGLLLVLLGILYSNAVSFDFANLSYRSVLGIIGLAWMFAALIYMNTRTTFRIIWFAGLLIVYWLALVLFPAHDLGSTDMFSPEGNLTGYIDRLLMPGPYGNSEQLFSVVPATGTALLGMLTGEFLQTKYLNDRPLRKVVCMMLAAIALMLTGKIWDLVFPINKHLWTSSFVCFAGGLSLLLFSVFHLVIEVWKYKKWAFFFIVIGLNPITIYLGRRIIDFKYTAGFFFDGIAALLPENWTQFINGIGLTAVCWIFLYILYRKKIFIKI
ncbi:MAG: acyltransferase family protein [Mangrovibacterium sp.]